LGVRVLDMLPRSRPGRLRHSRSSAAERLVLHVSEKLNLTADEQVIVTGTSVVTDGEQVQITQ
jgi:hypothetical protein